MEQRELLERIYEEVQGLSQRQTVMEQRLQNMENELRGEMQGMADTLREEMQGMEKKLRTEFQENIKDLRQELRLRTEQLERQATNNFAILDRDLGSAMDVFRWLNEHKVEKDALRQAAL